MSDIGMPATVTFRLGTLGALVTDRFTAKIADLDLKPKHVGVLTALAAGPPASQQELAGLTGVAPSLMVTLADHLEAIGAIARTRDAGDRRRMVLTLTARGRKLLTQCAKLAQDLDAELTASLSADQRVQLATALGVLAGENGLPI
ncbi:MarR family winged helix-turn-helix transcriptional regulator [Hamadaea sp. NPDC051192]|uniref:MarR family winged helix-turn-helix transcriptional regulator n=1 Tax=Hamadaea sp. NPDC051192 TaxID=3154940 RepID=UPI00341E79E8